MNILTIISCFLLGLILSRLLNFIDGVLLSILILIIKEEIIARLKE
jgi:hypothetical protein